MKINAATLMLTLATLLLIFLPSLKVIAQKSGDQSELAAIIDKRTQVMRNIRDAFEPLRAMLMAGEFEILLVKSTELENVAQNITRVFSTKALGDYSRATEKIWTEWDGFRGKANELVSAVSRLKNAAQDGNKQKTEDQINKVLAACKNCHRSFRRPQPEAEDEYQ